jgi:hypothetical protein
MDWIYLWLKVETFCEFEHFFDVSLFLYPPILTPYVNINFMCTSITSIQVDIEIAQ